MGMLDYGHQVRCQERRDEQLKAAGIGYTIATGRLFCDVNDLKEFASKLFGTSVMTHDLAVEAFWVNLRRAFEDQVKDALA